MSPKRKAIPTSLRSDVLIKNRHLCCVCQDGYLQIHHINGNNSDNQIENLAVLCMKHHDMATAPQGLTARLTSDQLMQYKIAHEAACAESMHKVARSRAAFFMVDYKNAERIRQLYVQLSKDEFLQAFCTLVGELREESELREQQGYSCSIEPTTEWNDDTHRFLLEVKKGEVHPKCFRRCQGHPKDPFLPIGIPQFCYYDLWIQIMIRALLVNRPALPLEDLARLDDIENAPIMGRLITLSGRVKGKCIHPDRFGTEPTSATHFSQKIGTTVLRSIFNLKTHYIYSDTAAQSLSSGRTQGVAVLRGIKSVKQQKTQRVIEFECSPLILGGGGGGELQIP